MKTLNQVVRNGNPTSQNETAAATCGLPNTPNSGDLARHEGNILLPPILPDEFKRLEKHRLVPVVVCANKNTDGMGTSITSDSAEESVGAELGNVVHTPSTRTANTGGQGDVLYVNQILQGDALSVLRTLPSNIVDECLTSPPYYAHRDYGVHGQLGLEETPQEYIRRLCDMFDEVKRVLKPTGTLWVNLGDTYSGMKVGNTNGQGTGTVKQKAGINTKSLMKRKTNISDKCLLQIPSRFAIEMTNRGWILRNEIVWHKPNCMPQSVKDRFTVDFEKVFLFTNTTRYHFEPQFEPLAESSVKRSKYGWHCDRANNGAGVDVESMRGRFCNPNGRNMRCVWSISTRGFKGAHFATYPEQLCETPIKAGCPVGGIVLDPFAGAGTTLVVAKKLGRRYVGIELNPDYCRITKERLNGHVAA